jgi:hypothetical protein
MARRPKVPEGEGKRRDGEGPADSPPPPPASETKEIEDAAEALKSIKFTPALCKELGEQMAGMEAMLYAVAARGFDDERWNLMPEEIEAQKRLFATGLLVYGESIKAFIIPVVLVFGISAPLTARLLFLGPKEKSSLGAPKVKEPTVKVVP